MSIALFPVVSTKICLSTGCVIFGEKEQDSVENHWSRDISSSPDCGKSFRKEMSRVAAVTLASKRQNIQRCQRGLAGNSPVTGRNLIRVLAVL